VNPKKRGGNVSLCTVLWNRNASPPPKQLRALSELQNSKRNEALAGRATTRVKKTRKVKKEKRREARA
jgi:hypothetical protein